VRVRRPLLADPLPLPPLTTAVTVPRLSASLLDTEYALILAVSGGNFSEPADVPGQIAWLHTSLLTTQQQQQQQQQQAAAASSPSVSAAGGASQPSGGSAAAAPGGSAGADDDGVAEVQRQVVSDFSCTSASLLGLLCDAITTKTTISIGQAQLQLWNAQPEGLPPASVGSIELRDMWVAVSMTQRGNMLLWLSLPSVCARDLRPGVPHEASLVLSTAEIGSASELGGPLSGTGATPLPAACPPKRRTGDGNACTGSGSSGGGMGSRRGGPLPSLLTLQYRAVSSIGGQPASALHVRLQRPTLVLDVGFIMKVLNFVTPGAGLQGPMPRPYASHEVHLAPDAPYLAPDHLWLSPEYRIIADGPGLSHAVYDGQGHALVLPSAVPSVEFVPLIVVGRGVTLRLRNVRLINQAGLAGVLALAPGARLLAEVADGVSWHGPEEALRLRNKAGRHIAVQAATQPHELEQPPGPAQGAMSIAVHAVGAAVYLIDAHAAGGGAGSQDGMAVASAAAGAAAGLAHGTSIPTPVRSASDSADAGGDAAAALADASSSATAAAAAAAAVPQPELSSSKRSSDVLRMLALYLDLGMSMQMQGANSEVAAQLLGLSVKAQTRLLEDAAAAAAAATQQPERSASGADSSGSGAAADARQPRSGQQQQQQQGGVQKQQETATSILEPCDIKVATKSSESVQDVNVDVSAVQLRMSPDVMQLLQHLQQVVMEPLAAPPADQPLARVTRFACLWSSHGPAEGGGAGPPYAIAGVAGAGGVAVIGSDKGVTVWRPQPPMGYALVGDVLSAGHGQPDHQVTAIAISSGLVTFPLGFTRVWESPGGARHAAGRCGAVAVHCMPGRMQWRWRAWFASWCSAAPTNPCVAHICTAGMSLWRPVPPPGYVPMGCIASTSMPERKACVVVVRQAVVPALLSECMMLCTNGNLWCVQNSAGTFEVAPPDTHQPQVRSSGGVAGGAGAAQRMASGMHACVPCLCRRTDSGRARTSAHTFVLRHHALQVPLYDLRSPLGVAPAALMQSPQAHAMVPAAAHHASGKSGNLLAAAVSALTQMPLPPSFVAARAFAADRAALRSKMAQSGQVCVRVWFNGQGQASVV
jgi:vacuolar protein sorting-associated protein 13A/C